VTYQEARDQLTAEGYDDKTVEAILSGFEQSEDVSALALSAAIAECEADSAA
jgi:hypothetical protein